MVYSNVVAPVTVMAKVPLYPSGSAPVTVITSLVARLWSVAVVRVATSTTRVMLEMVLPISRGAWPM